MLLFAAINLMTNTITFSVNDLLQSFRQPPAEPLDIALVVDILDYATHPCPKLFHGLCPRCRGSRFGLTTPDPRYGRLMQHCLLQVTRLL